MQVHRLGGQRGRDRPLWVGGLRARREALRPDGTVYSLALRHSNAGRYALGFGFGAQVVVCTNGVLAAEHIVTKKHTKNVHLDTEIRGGLERFLDSTRQISDFILRLREAKLAPRNVDRLLVQAGRSKVLPWSQLGKVDALWQNNPEGAFRPRTAWSLYNCFTEVSKERSAAGQFATLTGMGELFGAGRWGRRGGSGEAAATPT